jgi:hypothetical protein
MSQKELGRVEVLSRVRSKQLQVVEPGRVDARELPASEVAVETLPRRICSGLKRPEC